MMKKFVIITMLTLIISLLSLYLYFYLDRKNNPAKYSLYNTVKQISERRLQEGKVFEVILKEHVTDQEANTVLEELYKIEGVNGSSLYTREIQKNGEYDFLFPQDIVFIAPRSRVVIELDVENKNEKKSIIEQVKKNPNVDVVLDLIPR